MCSRSPLPRCPPGDRRGRLSADGPLEAAPAEASPSRRHRRDSPAPSGIWPAAGQTNRLGAGRDAVRPTSRALARHSPPDDRHPGIAAFPAALALGGRWAGQQGAWKSRDAQHDRAERAGRGRRRTVVVGWWRRWSSADARRGSSPCRSRPEAVLVWGSWRSHSTAWEATMLSGGGIVNVDWGIRAHAVHAASRPGPWCRVGVLLSSSWWSHRRIAALLSHGA